MRIVHFSDSHWAFERLPAADLYVCTGDTLDDHNSCDKYGNRSIRIERIKQFSQMAKFVKEIGFRSLLASPDAPIVAVRGNHDFADLAPLFEGCNLIHEFKNNEVVEVAGLKITGHRGVPYINGGFSDEMAVGDLVDRMHKMVVDADLYMTHYPPRGVLDESWGERFGLVSLQNWFDYRAIAPNPLHCFGHIHHHGGTVLKLGATTYSNAATTYNVIDGNPIDGWQDVSPL